VFIVAALEVEATPTVVVRGVVLALEVLVAVARWDVVPAYGLTFGESRENQPVKVLFEAVVETDVNIAIGEYEDVVIRILMVEVEVLAGEVVSIKPGIFSCQSLHRMHEIAKHLDDGFSLCPRR
jgi:hypothetical protein